MPIFPVSQFVRLAARPPHVGGAYDLRIEAISKSDDMQPHVSAQRRFLASRRIGLAFGSGCAKARLDGVGLLATRYRRRP